MPGGIEGPDALWEALLDGIDGITEVPSDRWPVDDDAETDAALGRAIARMDSWRALGWEGANESFVSRWWGRRGTAIAEQLARRRDALHRMRRYGVDVLDVDPRQLGPQLISRYLTLKQRALR